MTPFFVTRRSDDLCLDLVFFSWLGFFFFFFPLASGTFTGSHLVLVSQGYYFGWRQRRWIKKAFKDCVSEDTRQTKEGGQEKNKNSLLSSFLFPLLSCLFSLLFDWYFCLLMKRSCLLLSFTFVSSLKAKCLSIFNWLPFSSILFRWW